MRNEIAEIMSLRRTMECVPLSGGNEAVLSSANNSEMSITRISKPIQTYYYRGGGEAYGKWRATLAQPISTAAWLNISHKVERRRDLKACKVRVSDALWYTGDCLAMRYSAFASKSIMRWLIKIRKYVVWLPKIPSQYARQSRDTFQLLARPHQSSMHAARQ